MNFALKKWFSSGSRQEKVRLPRWIAPILLILACLASLSGEARERIMVYGDSLSAAYGLDPKDGWVKLLGDKLQTRQVDVVNSSISGETTLGGLSRIKTDLSMIHPTIVMLALGANDGLRGLPIEQTRKNLESMITASRTAGARVVLIGIQIPPNYGLDYARQFRDLYAELAAKHKLALVPFLLEGIAEKPELFQADHLHPTAAAQPRIVANVMPAVDQVLARKK